jgi:hypothetical protein
MVNFLNKIISTLPDSQKTAIRALIASKVAAGELLSIRAKQDDASAIYNRIKGKLNRTLLTPRYAVRDEKISSSDHNSNMEEIYLDLNALYSSINELYSLTSKQVISLNSEYQKSRAAIEKLINDVKVYSLRKQHPEFNEVKLIDFNASVNSSRKHPIAEINPNTRLLQLKPALVNRAHLPNRASRSTKIYTKTYSQGLKGELSATFPVQNMCDQKVESFWATLVLSDSPVSQVYEKNTVTGQTYQVAVNGPVVEVYFKFSHIEKINTIKILPFSEFPIRIIDVAFRSSPSSQILQKIEDFQDVTTLDWVEINIAPVFASEVRITIVQENYKKSSYLLPKSVVVNTDIFQRIVKYRASRVLGSAIADSDFSLYLVSSLSNYESAAQTLEALYKDSGVDLTIQPAITYYSDFAKLVESLYSELDPQQSSSIAASIAQQPSNPLVSITKYEYLLGIREVEINHQIYYPTSFYESEKYNTDATVSQIQIEVDERHNLISTEWQDDYRKTSTEWQIEIGEGRKFPIHPINIVDDIDGIPAAKDERLNFDLSTNKAYTRLGGYYSLPYRIKKNGDIIPPDKYVCTRITGSIPKLEVFLTGEYFDEGSLYSIDYAVDPSSYNIDILDKFASQEIASPEIFSSVGSDNNITLSKYPFINYEVINSTGTFAKESNKSVWKYSPLQRDVYSGQLVLRPTIVDSVGNILQTGSTTAHLITGQWGTQSGVPPVNLTGALSLSYFGEIKGIDFGYYVKVMDNSTYGHITQFTNSTGFTLSSPVSVTEEQCRRWDSQETGKVFIGSTISPMSGYLVSDYIIGVGVNTDGKVFAISDIEYSPLTITVGGKDATNITDYETLVHPAFSSSNSRDNKFEYIQAGKNIYFNQKIEQEIRVSYNWITEYIKVYGTLKYNSMIDPSLTPKVNEIRVFTNNLVI